LTFEDACMADGRVLVGITKQQAAEVKRLLAKQLCAGERERPANQQMPNQHLPKFLRGQIDLQPAPTAPEGAIRYQEAKQSIQPLISHLRDVFPIPKESSRRYSRNRSRGRLDSARLYRAGYGNEIFRTRCLMENQETILVGLLLDASTSMDYNRRCERTLEMAVLFNETFADHPGIDLHLFSHSTSLYRDACLLLRHGRAGDAGIAAKIGNYRTYNANYDYQAIWGAVACMSKEAAATSQRYLLVVSDGLPCTPNNSAGSGVKITRQAVSEVRRLGWKVVGIGIDDCHCNSIYGSNWTVNVSASRLTVETCRLLKWLIHRS
jgi:nitric oxide reductase activation protein